MSGEFFANCKGLKHRVLQHFAFCDPPDLGQGIGSPQQHDTEADGPGAFEEPVADGKRPEQSEQRRKMGS
jgi:hypothetical protein